MENDMNDMIRNSHKQKSVVASIPEPEEATIAGDTHIDSHSEPENIDFNDVIRNAKKGRSGY